MAMSCRITPRGPYSLDSQIEFLVGFTPAGYKRPATHDHLHLFFVVEESWQPVGACARADGDAVVITTSGPGAGTDAEAQMVRILSLDVDTTGFDSVCADDPVLGQVRADYPRLRPVLFGSVYQSLAWAILSQRVRMTQAAAAVARIADTYGQRVEICGREGTVFPTPTMLEAAQPVNSVTDTKIERLRGLADAVRRLNLTAAALRQVDDPLERLQMVEGIGPFSAELALIRGAGDPDVFPRHEKRLHTAMRSLYARPDANANELAQVAEAWKPWRAWASLLLRTAAQH